MIVEQKDHLFVLQTGEIPVNGDLSEVRVELCHQLSVVDIETGKVLGKSQGEGILNLGTPTELELEFPGFVDWIENIKIALVTKAMRMIAERKAALEVINNPPEEPLIE